MNRRKFIKSLLGAAIGAGIARKIPLPPTDQWKVVVSNTPLFSYGFTGAHASQITYRQLENGYLTACNSVLSPNLMIMSQRAHKAFLKSAYGTYEGVKRNDNRNHWI